MKIIENQTRIGSRDCITFKERTDQKNYLDIKISPGCSSLVGKLVKKVSQALSLDNDDCLKIEIILHELVHALGS